MFLNKGFFMDTEGGAGGAGSSKDDANKSNQPANFDEWYGKLEDGQKKLIDGHVSGLKSAISSEREENKTLLSQVRDAQKKAEKGSEAEKQLEALGDQLESAKKRIAFAEEATKPEIGCTNIKAAFLLAQADELFRKDGSPDWDAIKKAAPELFTGKKQSKGNPGNGTDNPPDKITMNDFIRHGAKRS
jgi:hypothetical protein